MTWWWIGVLALLVLSIVAALVATRTARYWFIAPAALPIITAIVLPVVGEPAPAHPAFTIGLAAGFVALATLGGSPVVALVLQLATRTVRLGTHGGILVADVDSPAPDREILRGGTTIGYVERFALIGSLIAGQPGAIAIVVAIKGLGRFSELENASARERFIIGTLVSLAWAGCCAAAIAPFAG